MGQTVSLNTCVSGGSIVRVMKTDGEFDMFDFPCISAEVMVKHPGHLVVHCTPVSKNSIGQRSKISLMLPDQPLLPGQPYMLYPIPDQYKKTLARSKSFSMLRKKIEASNNSSSSAPPPAVTVAERRQGRRKALKLIFTRLNLATFVAHNLNETSEGDAPPPRIDSAAAAAEEAKKAEEEEKDDVKPLRPKNLAALDYGWRPLLSPVPESPLGFHSVPQSPLGLYKMDGTPFSALAVGSRPLPTLVTAA